MPLLRHERLDILRPTMRGARELKLIISALTIDLGNRNLTLLGLARLAVSFASWAFTIALGVYGFEAHGAVGVGLVAVIRLLPGALASTRPLGSALKPRISSSFSVSVA